MKRSDVSIQEKFRCLSMAIDEVDKRPTTKWKTDIIGLACQYSVAPKLKREDFEGMLDLTIADVVAIASVNKNLMKR